MVDGIHEGPQIKPLGPQVLHDLGRPIFVASLPCGHQFQMQGIPLSTEVAFVQFPANLGLGCHEWVEIIWVKIQWNGRS